MTVFDRCNIIARDRRDISPPYGYITAPSTQNTAPYGLIVLNSRLTKEPGVPAKSFALGRRGTLLQHLMMAVMLILRLSDRRYLSIP